nr:hypothetical protein [Tanacetum cinerariifolium]
MLNDDERVANDLNKGKSDSSSSSVSRSNINIADFLIDSGNDAESSDGLVATQNEEVATLEENAPRQWNAKLTSTLIKMGLVRELILQGHLDQTGDWERWRARALDNLRTATREESLERPLSLFSNLDQGGRESKAFVKLKGKVFRRETPSLRRLWHIGQNSENKAL